MASNPSSAPKRQLTLFDCTCIIVGIIIGAGIYETTPLVAQNVSGPGWLIGAWLLGGVISLLGAVCYAELATTYPQEGGDYVYLTKAFGRRTGFLFAWAEFWIVRPGSIGAMAYVFARYAHQLWPLGMGQHDFVAYACGSILVLTGIHIVGVRTGKWTQNVLTAVKVVGLLAIFVVGWVLTVPRVSAEAISVKIGQGSFPQAMIFVLFAYSGWKEVSYVAAEVRNPRQNILRALVLGTGAVTAIYVLVNLAFIRSLGLAGVAHSRALAAEVVKPHFTRWGAAAISVLICISCLGAIHGMIFTGSRVYYALGTEHRLYAWLGQWSKGWDTPIRSLTIQAAVTLVLVLVIGFGMNEDGFERLVIFTAPLFWFFFLLVGLSLFVLRRKDPDAPRTYRVHFYPLVPILFCLSNLLMLYASLDYAIQQLRPESLWSILAMIVGLVLSLYDPPIDADKR